MTTQIQTFLTAYNVAADKWEPLPVAYAPAIPAAVAIAAKRQTVKLLALPLGRLVIQYS